MRLEVRDIRYFDIDEEQFCQEFETEFQLWCEDTLEEDDEVTDDDRREYVKEAIPELHPDDISVYQFARQVGDDYELEVW